MMQKKPPFTPLFEVLESYLSQSFQGRLRHTVLLQKKWHDIVGEAVAQRSRVLYHKDKRLHVAVQSSAWLMELGLQKNIILDKVRAHFPDLVIEDIKFRID